MVIVAACPHPYPLPHAGEGDRLRGRAVLRLGPYPSLPRKRRVRLPMPRNVWSAARRKSREDVMPSAVAAIARAKSRFWRVGGLAVAAALLALTGGDALAAGAKVTVAVGGESCICYLPVILARQLGYYEEAGVTVELIDFKGGSTALTAVLGGSADVVSGYYDHTVELAAKDKPMQSIIIYDNLPGEVLVVSPKSTDIASVKDLVGKPVGVSAPGSSTDFFLKYLLRKNGLDPNKVPVVGIGLGSA